MIREHTRAGLLGGHRPMGHSLNGWNFVTAGSARDANSVEEIMIELNRVGYDGAVSIEWEDNDAEQHAGAKAALANCPPCRPAAKRHAPRRDAEGLSCCAWIVSRCWSPGFSRLKPGLQLLQKLCTALDQRPGKGMASAIGRRNASNIAFGLA